MAEAFVLSWAFLLRVQSECLELQAGEASDLGKLPGGRHSCVFVDDQCRLVIVFARRKHRPKGSVLLRSCSCGTKGPATCPPHRLGPLLAQKRPGDRLWSFTSSALLKMLRRCLALLQAEGAAKFTFKAFRAGHATELATSGAAWAQILAAGEWRSMAALRYIDADAVDSSAATWEAVQNSSDEDLEG